MRPVIKELWKVFWMACRETPRGMIAPFLAFWRTATRNPVLDGREKRNHA